MNHRKLHWPEGFSGLECFLDVGANWGYFTLLAAHLVGKGGRVISLEPDPRLFSILLDNLTRNELDQAIALPHAAADSQGVLLLAGYRESGGNFGVSRVIANQPFEDACFQVLSDSLDSVLDEQRIDSVDLMKMDIEGAEALAVKGMSKSLATKKIKHLLSATGAASAATAGPGVLCRCCCRNPPCG